jgi:hypothetical protein
MINLQPYVEAFNDLYPDYADARYSEIQALMAVYHDEQVQKIVSGVDFKRYSELLVPLIKIKNYKSQIPFPDQISSVLLKISRLKQSEVPAVPLSGEPEKIFLEFIAMERQGFQLPTLSAVFHFCHPNDFPIVDTNVEAACRLLANWYPGDFGGLEIPRLPVSQTSPANKLRKYRAFIAFLDKICASQSRYMAEVDYRLIDKALMVFGVEKLRNGVERLGIKT